MGKFVSGEYGKPWTGRDGVERSEYVVGVLIGRQVVQVKYRDEAAFASVAGEMTELGVVALRVFVRAFAFEKRDRWEAAIEYRGVAARDSE